MLEEIKMLSDSRRNVDPGTRGIYNRLAAKAPKIPDTKENAC